MWVSVLKSHQAGDGGRSSAETSSSDSRGGGAEEIRCQEEPTPQEHEYIAQMEAQRRRIEELEQQQVRWSAATKGGQVWKI